MDLLGVVVLAGVCAAVAAAVGGGRSWPPWVLRALWLLAALGAMVAAARFAWTVAGWLRPDSPVNTYDFTVFYGAAQAARARATLYELAGIRQDPGAVTVYRHAPIGAALLAPLTWLPFRAALDLWRLLNAGLYVATFVVLARHYRLRRAMPLTPGPAVLRLAAAPGRR